MPRPSLKDQRRKEILDAYARCIARHGVEGATLERIASEAGLARALIRHNIGNREELLTALLARLKETTARDMDALAEALPNQDRSFTLVQWLFDPAAFDRMEALVGSALISAAGSDPQIASAMREWIGLFRQCIRTILAEEFAKADVVRIDTVASGLMGLYFSSESAAAVGGIDHLRSESLKAASILIDSLRCE